MERGFDGDCSKKFTFRIHVPACCFELPPDYFNSLNMTRMRSEIIFLDMNPQGVHASYIDTIGAKFLSSFHGILRIRTNFITTPVRWLVSCIGLSACLDRYRRGFKCQQT